MVLTDADFLLFNFIVFQFDLSTEIIKFKFLAEKNSKNYLPVSYFHVVQVNPHMLLLNKLFPLDFPDYCAKIE